MQNPKVCSGVIVNTDKSFDVGGFLLFQMAEEWLCYWQRNDLEIDQGVTYWGLQCHFWEWHYSWQKNDVIFDGALMSKLLEGWHYVVLLFSHYCSCPTIRDWIAVYPALFFWLSQFYFLWFRFLWFNLMSFDSNMFSSPPCSLSQFNFFAWDFHPFQQERRG